LCVSTWLTDFRSVNTSAARYQQLSLNQKLADNAVNKMLLFKFTKLDTYLDALKVSRYGNQITYRKGDVAKTRHL
jgi:hypothetical protein